MNKKKVVPALCAGFLLFTPAANATERTLALPDASGFPDTESSRTEPLSGWDATTRRFFVTVATDAAPSNAIEVAYGADRNADGALAPAETDLVLGCDCGEWFLRDERTASRIADAGDALPPTASNLLVRVFNVSRRFCRDWNLVKVTTRGASAPRASVTATYKTAPFVLILR